MADDILKQIQRIQRGGYIFGIFELIYYIAQTAQIDKMKPSISPLHKRIAKAILQNLRRFPQSDKQVFDRALAMYDSNPIEALQLIRQSPSRKQHFDEHLLEFNSWNQSFHKAIEKVGKKEELKGFDICEKLISLQNKIKLNNVHWSYLTFLVILLKSQKQLNLDSQFFDVWRDAKIQLKNSKLQQLQNKEGNPLTSHQPIQQPQIDQKQPQQKSSKPSTTQSGRNQRQAALEAERQREKQKRAQEARKIAEKAELDRKREEERRLADRQEQQRREARDRVEEDRRLERKEQQRKLAQRAQQQKRAEQQRKLQQQQQLKKQSQKTEQQQRKQAEQRKKQQQKQKETTRLKQNEAKWKKIKQDRFATMMKYLESRKEWTYGASGASQREVAKEILHNLERFMKEKMEKILRYSKMRTPRIQFEGIGDQFKMYSNKSNIFSPKHSIMLPQTQIKILRVRYPSKSQRYVKLRIEQQKLQQKLKQQLKQKIEADKKLQKIIHSYIITDQNVQHEFQKDEGPPKRQRLFVPTLAIQYVIQMDPWFGDQFIMEKTFYRT